jgi:hypothetical protein
LASTFLGVRSYGVWPMWMSYKFALTSRHSRQCPVCRAGPCVGVLHGQIIIVWKGLVQSASCGSMVVQIWFKYFWADFRAVPGGNAAPLLPCAGVGVHTGIRLIAGISTSSLAQAKERNLGSEPMDRTVIRIDVYHSPDSALEHIRKTQLPIHSYHLKRL